jgi:3-oxoacyl-[acyl-carrier protein] reductase
MTATIDLDGKVAFVTGAAGGIGRATTRRLLECGCVVVANVYRLDDRSREALASFESFGAGRVILVEGSIAESATIEAAVKVIFQRFKRLDVVVNNAGVLGDAVIGMISDQMIDEVLHTNLVSVIKVTQTMGRLMKRQKSGSIVNLSSIIGRRGNIAQLVYGASKAGVIGATLSASRELAVHGVRVNAVAPGFIDTPMTANLPTEARENIVSQIGMGRIGTAEEIADVILFLASDFSRYVTGQVVGVDGGWTL